MTKLTEEEKQVLIVEGRRALIHLLTEAEKGLCSFCKQDTLSTAVVSGSGATICLKCFQAAGRELQTKGLLPTF